MVPPQGERGGKRKKKEMRKEEGQTIMAASHTE
jgi:hypothetical protein